MTDRALYCCVVNFSLAIPWFKADELLKGLSQHKVTRTVIITRPSRSTYDYEYNVLAEPGRSSNHEQFHCTTLNTCREKQWLSPWQSDAAQKRPDPVYRVWQQTHVPPLERSLSRDDHFYPSPAQPSSAGIRRETREPRYPLQPDQQKMEFGGPGRPLSRRSSTTFTSESVCIPYLN